MINNSQSTQFGNRTISSVEHPLYPETVYAGLLGKLIGVYLGRPVENWLPEKIAEEFGEIRYYVHEQRGRRLIITDDDISGTLTFFRALQDYNYNPEISPAQIGQTWLNYLIKEKTILWWGGLGNSTEHTAYLRLQAGINAPKSGSIELNSKIVAEQIGAQIFIDAWGLINPGDPERATDFARRAASVSHDGEAIYGAQIVAALIAQCFTDTDINSLLDCAVSFIPADSTVRKLIDDIREWHMRGLSWRETLSQIHIHYGYDKYRGQCHLIPNHALIILSLIYGQGDFDETMMIVNTAGWDTDCNSGNVGTILGVMNGLDGFNKQDWRGPVADRLYLPSADPGRSISDAVTETLEIVQAARLMRGLEKLPTAPKEKFSFFFAGSVQGFHIEDPSTGSLKNICDDSSGVSRGILIQQSTSSTKPAVAITPTFIPPDTKDMVTGYVLVACPTLYSGHHVTARLEGTERFSRGRIMIRHYNELDESVTVAGPEFSLQPHQKGELEWNIPDTHGYPICHIGFELSEGEFLLNSLDWNNIPETTWPPVEGTMWARAWGNALDRFSPARDKYEYLSQNSGTGFLAQGHRDWKNYAVSARLTPRMAESSGIAFRYQGTRRYYAFVFGKPGEVRIEKCLDGTKYLATVAYPWQQFHDYEVKVEVQENRFRVFINEELIIQASDNENSLVSGGFAFTITEGCMGAGTPAIKPLP